MARLLCAVACASVLIACAEPRPEGDITNDQIAAFRLQHRQIEIIAQRYDNAISTATEDTANVCISMQRTYARDIGDRVVQLRLLAPELDATITDHGGGPAADLGCITAAITAELDYHGAVACQETALADNQAEAARHLIALGTLVEHAAARIAEIETGLASEADTWTWTLPSRCP